VNASDPLRILLSRAAAQRIEPRIRQELLGREVVLLFPDQPDAATADIAFISREVTGLSTKHRILPDTQQFYDALLAGKSLQWVHVHSAGVDRAVYLELLARGVTIATSAGVNGPVVAQTAVLGVLALARQWPRLLAAQRERRWAPLLGSGLPRDLRGQTAVIVGWGPIGQEIGRLLQAFGLEIVTVRRSNSAQLHSLLPSADWLVLACSLTPETRGFIDARAIALLPRHAHLVNICRGEVVDEPALIAALQEQRIAGAYLDVFAQEPLAADSPLWDMPNVIATPHSAGFSDANEAGVDAMFLANLARWVRGEALQNVHMA
jgi:phosphoglycerate dehydrogenase-like enzyme